MVKTSMTIAPVSEYSCRTSTSGKSTATLLSARIARSPEAAGGASASVPPSGGDAARAGALAEGAGGTSGSGRSAVSAKTTSVDTAAQKKSPSATERASDGWTVPTSGITMTPMSRNTTRIGFAPPALAWKSRNRRSPVSRMWIAGY